jgi:hypothetical protein
MPAPPPATLKGVAQLLGEATGTRVEADAFVWEPSRGVIGDAVFGRRVLFLGRGSRWEPRDLFRAAVRVTFEGHPVAVQHAANLSSSPIGDEQGLVRQGQHAAYVTVAYGAVQQVTLLDLRGERGGDEGVIDAVMRRLTNLQVTGSLAGLARTEVSAGNQARSATLTLGPDALEVSVDAGRARFAVAVESGKVSGLPDARAGVSTLQVPHLSKPPILWAVDTVRAFTGPGPIAWLEEHVFEVRDLAKRIGYEVLERGGKRGENQIASEVSGPPPVVVPPPRKVGADGFEQDDSWPPQPLASIWKEREEGEGQWAPARHGFLKKNVVPGAQEQAPSYFYESYVRPDPKRPYSQVRLVAMDARQLQLGMEGGVEDPQPLTGARGEGRIPRDPKTLYRVVGAFNGAFKTTHGEYGMMVNRRVLLPPKPGAATILVNADGRTGFGTWPQTPAIPQDMLSFRQNLEPLVDGGIANPSQRKQWGWHSHATGMLTHRSALCLTASGHMIYAWGPEVTGDTLGNALVQAGCVYAVHLDMNPRHTAFVYLDVRGLGSRNYDAKILAPAMDVLPERFIRWSPKDFFYLTLRELVPAVEGLDIQTDPGTQPPPCWAPAVLRGNVGGVELFAFAPNRTLFRLQPGVSPTDSSGAARLASTDARRVLAALVTGAMSGAGGSADPSAMLTITRQGTLDIVPQPGSGVPKGLQLPVLTADTGGSDREKRRRAAICKAGDGHVWVATAFLTTSAPLVAALEKVGCTLIASLDRGGRGMRVDRAGTKHPPMDQYETAAVYVLGTEMQPGAFAWRNDAVAPGLATGEGKAHGTTAEKAAQPERPR